MHSDHSNQSRRSDGFLVLLIKMGAFCYMKVEAFLYMRLKAFLHMKLLSVKSSVVVQLVRSTDRLVFHNFWNNLNFVVDHSGGHV